MRRSLKFRNYKTTKLQNPQRGYMLITLMLAVALMSIAMLAVLPRIRQQIQRDRELELQHRGTAYMRAIQHFYKKFGRYPTRVEELENTNNLKFLRKRYKDPVNRDPATGKERDFKFLRQQDITLNSGPVLPGQTQGQPPFGGQGGQSPQGGLGGNTPGGFGGGAGGFGGSPGGIGAQGAQQQPGPASTQTPATGEPGSGSDAEGNSNSSSSSPNTSSGSQSSSGLNGPTFGGGPILGVASTNKKDKSIRVFFEKNHYSDWFFIYVPMADRGGLLTGPVNPSAPVTNLNGATPAGGIPGQGQGQAPGLGQPITPNTGSQNPGTQPQQNPGQNPPEE
jgi:type II secretory pathway pseudopilin PulG